MVPAPGESPVDWWGNTRWEEARRAEVEHLGGDDRNQSGTPFAKPFPIERWPDVPSRFPLCRDDRFFPAEFQRRLVRERLGFTPDEMGGGHLPMLARPVELVDRLESHRSGD